MNTHKGNGKARLLALAVQGALIAGYGIQARADETEDAVKRLTQPTSTVEVGGMEISKSSAKFGEYSGLNKSGTYVIGNIDLRGGDPNGGLRWNITGTDLGLTTRAFGASVRDQGKWSLGFNYDELKHFTSDTYQTPYIGSLGSNSWSLPAGFAAAAPNARTLSAAQLSKFQNLDISDTRLNTSLNGSYTLNSEWDVKVDYNRLDQSGARLMGFGGAGFGGATGERIAILPMPKSYQTDTINAALNWNGEKGHATFAYYGSFFRDAFNGVSFQTWSGAGAPTTQTMSTAPSNNFNQFNLSGGYALSTRTKLVGGFSYARNTQNASYAFDPGMMLTASPTSTLNGSVRTTHVDVKLTDQTTRQLTMTAAYKYDDRDNRTASNIYNSISIDGGNAYNYPNAPYSIKKQQLEVAGDYRIDTRQKLRLGYNHESIDRKCDQYATGGANPAYAPGTDCVTVPHSKEDKLGATYRLRATDTVGLNLGYTYSDRRSNRDFNARPPMIGRDGNPTAAGIAAAPPGITGLNGGEFIGFNPFYLASRTQNLFKAGANWDATERLQLSATGRFAHDNYDTLFGMQSGHLWSANVDGSYAYRDQGTMSLFFTHQDRARNMMNAARSTLSAPTATVPTGASWWNRMKDTDTTVGFGIKQGGLLGGRLNLSGDLSHSLGKTSYVTNLNYQLLSGAPCDAATILTCVALPDIRSSMTQLKVNGVYDIDKVSKVSVMLLYRRLSNIDYYYNGLQNGFTPTSVLPTNQQAPSYSVYLLGASYIYNFQ